MFSLSFKKQIKKSYTAKLTIDIPVETNSVCTYSVDGEGLILPTKPVTYFQFDPNEYSYVTTESIPLATVGGETAIDNGMIKVNASWKSAGSNKTLGDIKKITYTGKYFYKSNCMTSYDQGIQFSYHDINFTSNSNDDAKGQIRRLPTETNPLGELLYGSADTVNTWYDIKLEAVKREISTVDGHSQMDVKFYVDNVLVKEWVASDVLASANDTNEFEFRADSNGLLAFKDMHAEIEW